MDFVRSHFGKMQRWPVEHFFPYFFFQISTDKFWKLPTVLTFFCYVIYERSQGKARQGDGWGCWFIFGAVSWDPPKKPGADVTGILHTQHLSTGLTAYECKHENLWTLNHGCRHFSTDFLRNGWNTSPNLIFWNFILENNSGAPLGWIVGPWPRSSSRGATITARVYTVV